MRAWLAPGRTSRAGSGNAFKSGPKSPNNFESFIVTASPVWTFRAIGRIRDTAKCHRGQAPLQRQTGQDQKVRASGRIRLAVGRILKVAFRVWNQGFRGTFDGDDRVGMKTSALALATTVLAGATLGLIGRRAGADEAGPCGQRRSRARRRPPPAPVAPSSSRKPHAGRRARRAAVGRVAKRSRRHLLRHVPQRSRQSRRAVAGRLHRDEGPGAARASSRR